MLLGETCGDPTLFLPFILCNYFNRVYSIYSVTRRVGAPPFSADYASEDRVSSLLSACCSVSARPFSGYAVPARGDRLPISPETIIKIISPIKLTTRTIAITLKLIAKLAMTTTKAAEILRWAVARPTTGLVSRAGPPKTYPIPSEINMNTIATPMAPVTKGAQDRLIT